MSKNTNKIIKSIFEILKGDFLNDELNKHYNVKYSMYNQDKFESKDICDAMVVDDFILYFLSNLDRHRYSSHVTITGILFIDVANLDIYIAKYTSDSETPKWDVVEVDWSDIVGYKVMYLTRAWVYKNDNIYSKKLVELLDSKMIATSASVDSICKYHGTETSISEIKTNVIRLKKYREGKFTKREREIKKILDGDEHKGSLMIPYEKAVKIKESEFGVVRASGEDVIITYYSKDEYRDILVARKTPDGFVNDVIIKGSDVTQDLSDVYLEIIPVVKIVISNEGITQAEHTVGRNYRYRDFLKNSKFRDLVHIIDPRVFDVELFKYTKSILNNVSEENLGNAIISLIENPFFEQLYKSGHEDLVISAFSLDFSKTPLELLERVFGKTKMGEKKLHRKFGLNPYQLNRLIDLVELNLLDPIIATKMLLTGENPLESFVDISTYDNETFEKAIAISIGYFPEFNLEFPRSKKSTTHFFDGSRKSIPFRVARLMYSPKNQEEKIFDLNDVYNSYEHISGFKSDEEHLIDFIEVVMDYNEIYKYKFKPSLVENIEANFSQLTEVIETLRDNIVSSKFKSVTKKWKVMEYEDHETDLCIVVPDSPDDIVNEGAELRHCVGSFVNRIVAEDTFILFVRSIDDKDKALYTLEVFPESGRIGQYYGYRNSNPSFEANKFVQKWKREVLDKKMFLIK